MSVFASVCVEFVFWLENRWYLMLEEDTVGHLYLYLYLYFGWKLDGIWCCKRNTVAGHLQSSFNSGIANGPSPKYSGKRWHSVDVDAKMSQLLAKYCFAGSYLIFVKRIDPQYTIFLSKCKIVHQNIFNLKKKNTENLYIIDALA